MHEIKTERLILRPMCTDYLASTHIYASDAENCRYMTYLPNETVEETLAYLKEAEAEFAKAVPSFYEMAVFFGKIHIGAVSLYLNEDRTAGEFGWMIQKTYQGHGYAFEAAKALLDFAEEKLGIRHFTASCDTENLPSQRVMEKLGMHRKEIYSGRKNKLSDEERTGYRYELIL